MGKATRVLLAMAILAAAASTYGDEADSLFDDSYVHEIRIYFADPNWYEVLLQSHRNDPEDPYFPARFEYEGTVLDPVGVRFKGNSSFGIQGVKKSFKIDFNLFANDTRLLGLKKLNLNNGFKDPSLLREKLFLDFAGRFMPAIRAGFARVYVNDQYWGLYSVVEQLDKSFLQSRFGSDEDGNLFEGEGSGNAFGSDLSYLGPDPEPYFDYYQLRTNEDANDWSGLVEFITILNNTPPAGLPAQLEPIFDLTTWLEALALNSLFVNLDSYCGSAHNYYLYDRDDTGRFTHLHWDTNETFGSFRFALPANQDVITLDPFWLPAAPPNQPSHPRPLMANIWAVEQYRRQYLRIMAGMLREGFDAVTMDERIQELADLIRDDVYADINKPYSNAEFETSLTQDLGQGRNALYGLLRFVTERSTFIGNRLDAAASRSDLRCNELMPVNVATTTDNHGDHDPWLEIYNLGPGTVVLSGLTLSDDPGVPGLWPIPQGTLAAGDMLLFWLDGESGEGENHTSFTIQPGASEVFLFKSFSGDYRLIDSVPCPALAPDQTIIRLPDGEGEWQPSDRPTPGQANQGGTAAPSVLLINELMADNQATIEDPAEPGVFEDWLEIYNPGAVAVDMAGMYLTDDLADPVGWQAPAGMTVPARGFLVLWADNDPEQGDTHTSFRLAAAGEAIGLFASDGTTMIDSVVFAAQATDQSFGRYPDGEGSWANLATPTPGGPNSGRMANSSRPREPGARLSP